jgi:hypothetical protein
MATQKYLRAMKILQQSIATTSSYQWQRLVWVRAFCAADTDRVTSIWIARCGMGSGSLEPINDLLRIG